MIASFAVGALATQSLHAYASTSRPAYFVTIFDVGLIQSDTDYPSLYPGTFQPFGGYYVVQNGRTITFDGKPPDKFVVVAFDSMQQVLAWRASSAFKELYDVEKITEVRAFAVEGVAQ